MACPFRRNCLAAPLDSQSALATLRGGPAAQTSPLGAAIWEGLIALSRSGARPVHLQWVPSYCEPTVNLLSYLL